MKNKSLIYNSLLKSSKEMPLKHLGQQLTKFKVEMAKNNTASFTQYALQLHKEKNINDFLRSYNNVRQCDDRWPECESMEDWYNLPEEIKKECCENHKFSPTHYIQDSGDKNFFEPTVESLLLNEPDFDPNIFNVTGYTVNQLSRTQHIIYENLKYIHGSDIVEFASGDGVLSAAAINMGARSSTITDVSKYNLKICQKTKEIMDYDDNILTVLDSDITNKEDTQKLCYNKDVILLVSILTLIEAKHAVLKNIAESKPKYIIISELLDPTSFDNTNDQNLQNRKKISDIIESPVPAVQYIKLDCKKTQSALWSQLNPENFENVYSNSSIMLSVPNISWYDFTLKNLGYSKVNFCRWSSNIHNIDIDERFTAVYELD